MRGVWTRERIALLKKLWADGETPRPLPCSSAHVEVRGARQDVPLAASVERRKRSTLAARRDVATVGPAPPRPACRQSLRHPVIPVIPAAPVMAAGKTLFELTDNYLPLAARPPGTKTFLFCGAPGADLECGRPYCERHARRAYVGHRKTSAPAAPAARRMLHHIALHRAVWRETASACVSQGRKRS